ncbi:MAG: iron-sulfur cluster assembly scaffold protein [Chloroflexia bacterium]
MDRQSQIDQLLELYQHPEHKAPMPDADVSAQGGNPGCGDIVTYHLKVGADGRIEALTFEGEGCTISQAAAELVAEEAEGVSLAEIEAMTHDEIVDLLGRDVVMSRPRCATLALGTLKDAVRTYRRSHPESAG